MWREKEEEGREEGAAVFFAVQWSDVRLTEGRLRFASTQLNVTRRVAERIRSLSDSAQVSREPGASVAAVGVGQSRSS